MELTRDNERGLMYSKSAYSIGTSKTSPCFPFYVLCHKRYRYHLDREGRPFIMFNLPVGDVYHNVIGRYDQLINRLHTQMMPDRFEFVFEQETYHIYCMRHCILDTNNRPLLLMVCDGKDRLTPDGFVREREAIEEVSDMKLLISTELMLEDRYTNVWKKLEKEYVRGFYRNGLRVEYTTSERIVSEVFNDSIEVHFADTAHMSDHLRNDVPEILRDAFQRRRHEGILHLDIDYMPEESFEEFLDTDTGSLIDVRRGGTNMIYRNGTDMTSYTVQSEMYTLASAEVRMRDNGEDFVTSASNETENVTENVPDDLPF